MKKHKLSTLFVALVTAGLIACGGGDEPIDANDNDENDEPVDTLECADGTYHDEVTDECVAEQPECDGDEVYIEDKNACGRITDNYCGEGTQFEGGQCVSIKNPDTECGDDTTDVDGECVAVDRQCGEKTVVFGGECVPDDICGENTTDDSGIDEVTNCRPTEDVCGEGTVFDVAIQKCIPEDELECGTGTVNENDICIPADGFYKDMANDPDIDMNADGATGDITLASIGDYVSFVGTIEAPEVVDGQHVQQDDVLHVDADAGQWIRVTLFSLGLPEPGFGFESDNDYVRYSDRGVGLETSREILVPYDGTHELIISNMPQLVGGQSPAGGDDWEYVGYVETLDAPAAESVDVFNDTISGDITDLQENFYAVDGMDGVADLQLIFGSIPEDADGDVQVWSDETTLDSVVDIDSLSISVVPPSDSFYLVFDREHAYGSQTSYAFSGVEAQPLDDGASITEDHVLEAGDYIGVSQFNTDDEVLSATISDEDGVLATTNSLVVSIADSGMTHLYWFADEATTVTVDIENTTGADLDSVSYTVTTRAADVIDVDDGDLQEHDFTEPLSRGQRHYYQLNVTYDDMLAFRAVDGDSPGYLSLSDDSGATVVADLDAIIHVMQPQTYLLYVEAQGSMGDGYTLEIEEALIFDVTETSSPNLIIPRGQTVSDTIDITTCPSIDDIEIYVQIDHWWRGDLIVDVIAPNGQVARIHNESGGGTDDIIGTYPYPSDSGLEDGTELLNFIDDNGAGTWEIEITDTYSFGTTSDDGLQTWTIDLVCSG